MVETRFEHLRGETYPTALEDQLEALETDAQLERFAESRKRLAADPFRPLYHFSAPVGWMNDANGLCQWQERYHLFYQLRPGGRQDRVHWGHTVSDDLVHWRDLPPALYPDREKDCYSGQTLVEPDRVIAIYHGTVSGNSIATASDPLLLNWRKHPDNPVIQGDTESIDRPPAEVEKDGARYRVFDPCIWKEEDGYYCLSGTYKDGDIEVDCRSVDHLFRSKDLAEWEYLGPLIEDSFNTEPGEDGAVPNFWPIGNSKHMLLLFSHKRSARYYIGDYDRATHRLTPDYHGRMSYGPISIGSLHAPSATIDDSGRYLAIFNVKEGKAAQGWNDVMTLPRVFSLDSDNSLLIEPATEVESLRFDHRHLGPLDVPANGEMELAGIGGKALEIEAVIDRGDAREVGLYVRRSPDGQERTRISFYRNNPHRAVRPRSHGNSYLQIDVAESSTRGDVIARTPETGPLVIGDDEPVRLRVFVDRSIVEVFANGKQCLTLRAYPDREDSSGVSVFARGGAARLTSLDAWQMRSIWPDLKSREGT